MMGRKVKRNEWMGAGIRMDNLIDDYDLKSVIEIWSSDLASTGRSPYSKSPPE
jgi:hypothetical protein